VRSRWKVWATLHLSGSSHARHVHGGDLTAIYYATSGSGRIGFELPGGIEFIEPKVGLLLVAPSNLYHFVEPCSGSAPRVAIGFEAL
jgi:hypothetical protein